MASLPPYDQRYVVRDGGFKTRSAAISLCIACGDSSSCSAFSAMELQQETLGITASVLMCQIFRPVITFKDEAGTSELFNTFRKGLGWYKRVAPGDTVKLYDADKCRIIGEGYIKSRYCGFLSDMLTQHAHMNHLMKDEQSENPVKDLHSELRRLYGNNYAALDEEYSVIYVERSITELTSKEGVNAW
jgi:hypothetical protein